MSDNIDDIDLARLLTDIANIKNLTDLDNLRISILGKKGKLTAKLKNLSSYAPELRREMGQELNKQKQEINGAIVTKHKQLHDFALEQKLKLESLDISLDKFDFNDGRLHPITKTLQDIYAIFGKMGFEVSDGPDIEDDFHNFTALNVPPSHPAREMQDTFYLKNTDENGDNLVLRTQTSNVQIRTMVKKQLPIKIIAPGRTYRSDSDNTHTPMFSQVEGLVIDKTANFADLKGCLYSFVDAFFGLDHVPLRFRPSYFPFTEPSAEVDIACAKKDGKLHIGEGDDWLEVLGCGMVHPNVLINCGLDPNEYQGFAFGMGIERIAMLKYGIADLRTFFSSDIRWLKHYGFKTIDSLMI